MKNAICLLFFCLLLTACGSDKSAVSGGDASQGYKPSLDVKLDIQGRTVTVHVETDLHISPEHYGMARKEGEGHIHMYLDDSDKIGVKEKDKVFDNVPVGHHTLKVSLHNNDHTPYDVTKTIEFDVK